MVLKLGIFGLRFYVCLKCHFKKRKKSRFFDKKERKNVFSNYVYTQSCVQEFLLS